MSKFFIAFLLFFSVSTLVNATVGCIRTDRSTIYTSLRSGTQYNASPAIAAGAGCLFIFTGGACTIRSGIGAGFLGDTANPKECPIDDYIWVMMILFGGLGYYVLRKNAPKLSAA